MKLIDNITAAVIDLPDDLLWKDELDWLPVVAENTYSLTGSLIIELATKLAGRPITLEPPEIELAWVLRSTVAALRTAASIAARKFTLVLEYPTDTRQFTVVFDHSANPLEAVPVKGFPDHEDGAYFRVKIKLLEVL